MTSTSLVEALEESFRRCRDMDASLNERLQSFAGDVRTMSPPFAAAVDRLVARLQDSGAGSTAPAEGDPMPPFLLPDDSGRLVSLGEMIDKGPAAIIFHRGHWCPYCRINTATLARAQDTFRDAGGQTVAIMPDRQQFTTALRSEAKVPFPILTDLDNGYALSLNLAIWVGDEMKQMIARAGVDLPTYHGNETWMLPIPATFVVGTDGLVKARFVDPDYRKRMAIEDIVAALRSA